MRRNLASCFLLLLVAGGCRKNEGNSREAPPEPNWAERRAGMVTELADGGVENERVLEAMGRVERHRFVPRNMARQAYLQSPLPIGEETDPITLHARKLALWGNEVLVVQLEPADAGSALRLDTLSRRRSQESADWGARYSRRPLGRYTPHCTLGYFADRVDGCALRDNEKLLSALRETASEALGDTTVTLNRWSLHGFIDMATFFKLS